MSDEVSVDDVDLLLDEMESKLIAVEREIQRDCSNYCFVQRAF